MKLPIDKAGVIVVTVVIQIELFTCQITCTENLNMLFDNSDQWLDITNILLTYQIQIEILKTFFLISHFVLKVTEMQAALTEILLAFKS